MATTPAVVCREFIPLWGGQAANLPRFGVGIGNVGQIGVGRLDSASDWVGLQRVRVGVRPTLGGASNLGRCVPDWVGQAGVPLWVGAGGGCPLWIGQSGHSSFHTPVHLHLHL